jgi:hypothetical protein
VITFFTSASTLQEAPSMLGSGLDFALGVSEPGRAALLALDAGHSDPLGFFQAG